MDLKSLVAQIDAPTARSFVTAARHFIDALLIESQRVSQTATPSPHDYDAGPALRRDAPAGGWISDEELRGATQRMSEAIALEKWTDGVVFAVQALSAIGAL